MSGWFPRPRSVRDLVWLGPSGELDVERLFALLCSPQASEWRDKVAVTSPADGSGKPTTRLLHADGWVFKTDTGAAGERREVERRVAKLLQLAARVELWHPDKRWFLLRTEPPGQPERWWPISVCPRLTTLRAVRSWDRFAGLWARALGFGLERARIEGVGLDLGPANFGFEPGDEVDGELVGALYYIDDETYSPLVLSDLAEAIVGRIPEWPDNDGDRWREFGLLLRGLLEPVLTRPSEWDALREALAAVVLAPRWGPARAALIGGIERRPAAGDRGRPRAPAPRTEPQRLGLISDVHANLPALEATIAAGEAEGVDGWLFLGDAVGYGPHPRECVERLASLPNLIGVRGNHDHMACFGVEPRANSMARLSLSFARAELGEPERRWLMALPIEQLGPSWLAVHGAPIDPLRFNAYVYAMSYRRNLEHLAVGSRTLCVHGHTHVPMVYRMPSGSAAEAAAEVIPIPHDGFELPLRDYAALLINPGSVGQPRDGDPRAAFAIWDRPRERVRFRRVDYPVMKTCRAILRAGLPDDLATRLELGR